MKKAAEARKARAGKEGVLLLLAFLGVLLLELSGPWCLCGAVLAITCFLFFFRCASGDERRVRARSVPLARSGASSPPERRAGARLAAPGA